MEGRPLTPRGGESKQQEFLLSKFAQVDLRIVQGATWFAYIFMVAMNAIGNTVTFNGQTNGSISDKYPTAFTPAGWAFSIWGVIFTWNGIYCIYQTLPKHRENGSVVDKIGVLVAANFIINGLWAVPFAYEEFWLSIILMLCLLGTLIACYRILKIGVWPDDAAPRRKVGTTEEEPATTDDAGKSTSAYMQEFWCVHGMVSIYMGWISVATIANFAIFFTAEPFNWKEGAAGWSTLMQAVAAGLALVMLYQHLDVIYAGVIVWATFAIADKQRADRNIADPALALATTVGAAALATLGYRMWRFSRGV